MFETPEIDAIAWFNSKPLKISKIKDKVILVDFWTYTCINCQRTLPYIKNWWKKYKDKGLVIIGVHSPEFEFEKEVKNVENAVKEFNIKYPVAVDSEMKTWNAFNNQYWPAKYLIKDGNIMYNHFGEGSYEETEKVIQELLGIEQSLEVEKTVARNILISPETYAGSLRNSGLGSSQVCSKEGCIYIDPGNHKRDVIYLHGKWIQKPEYIELISGKGKFAFRFYAKEVNVVMQPVKGNVEGSVTIDGKKSEGEHIKNGKLIVDRPIMYNAYKNKEYVEKELAIKFEKSVRIYVLTFG